MVLEHREAVLTKNKVMRLKMDGSGKPKVALVNTPTKIGGSAKPKTNKRKSYEYMDKIRELLPTLKVVGSDGIAPNCLKVKGCTKKEFQRVHNELAAQFRRKGIRFSTNTQKENGEKVMTVCRLRKARSVAPAATETAPAVNTEKGKTTNGNSNGSYLPLQDAFGLL